MRRSRKQQASDTREQAGRRAARSGPDHGTPSHSQPAAPAWGAGALAALAVVLNARGFKVGLVGDDYTLLDAALRVPLPDLLSGRHGILGYYRPISRELYFWWWGRVCNLDAFGFHLVNAFTYGAVVAMFFVFVRRWLGPRHALLAATAFVVFPAAGALLSWVSCAQDLIALFWSTAALLLYQRGQRAPAGVAVALAVLSKETAAILPFAIAVFDWSASGAPRQGRLARLAPVFAGSAIAIAVAIAVRFTWPAGSSIAVWSPRQMAGAWRLPHGFVRTLWPPDTIAGIGTALRENPLVLAVAAALAALVPSRGTRGTSTVTPGRATAHASAGPDVAPRPERHAAVERGAIVFGAALLLLGILPVSVIVERWRGYFFSFAALGSSLLFAVALARVPAVFARSILAAAAVVSYGANSFYRPVEASWAPARHPHVNHTFFRRTSELSDRMLASLGPWCEPLAATRRSFTLGVPRQTTFDNVLGPGLRVTCRDTVARLHSLEDFTVADARSDFGLMRFDPQAQSFTHERAGARVRTALGEWFLLFRRYDVAAACFGAARAEAANPALLYSQVVALAAAGRAEEARAAWNAAGALAPTPEAFVGRLTASSTARSDASRDTTRRLAAAVLRAPEDAEAHARLGRHLRAIGSPRHAALELSVAYGIARRPIDLFGLAEAYEAMGAVHEAREAYGLAFRRGLPPPLRGQALQRMRALERIRAFATAGEQLVR